MTTQERPPISALAVSGVIGAILCFGLASFWLFGVAGAQGGSTVGEAGWGRDHITVLNSEGRFTGPGDWPPAPHEARTPLVRSTREVDLERRRVVARIEAQPHTRRLLGDKYHLTSSSHPPLEHAGAAKGAVDRSRLEVVWFSRSTNQTVIAVSDAAGHQLIELRTVPAADMQPDLTDDEDELAIQLARTFWQDAGSDVDDLEGFSIWALREDGRVYDVRMAYVSFHPTREHEPELLTWVDLTNETIVRSEVLR